MTAEPTRYVICGECPYAYTTDAIDVLLSGATVMRLDQLDAGAPPASAPPERRTTSITRTLLGGGKPRGGRKPPRGESQPANPPEERRLDLRRLQRFEFRCPNGHTVDGNRGEQFPIAVLGASGASKSHFLPAIVRDLDDMSILSPLGVRLTKSLYANSKVTDDAADVYEENRALEATPTETGVLGPYGYRLSLGSRPGDPDATEYSLLLFDVAGENLADIMRVAEAARFLLLSRAMIVLIDPDKFLPSSFDPSVRLSPQKRLNAAVHVRRGIRVIIDSLAEAWATPTRNLEVPFCFVVAKADAVDWKPGFAWSEQTGRVLQALTSGGDRESVLLGSSAAARAALCSLGGEHVVTEIESLLDPRWIRYAAASATSAMPVSEPERDGGSSWMLEPAPQGVGLVMLQVFDMAGILPGPPPAFEVIY